MARSFVEPNARLPSPTTSGPSTAMSTGPTVRRGTLRRAGSTQPMRNRDAAGRCAPWSRPRRDERALALTIAVHASRSHHQGGTHAPHTAPAVHPDRAGPRRRTGRRRPERPRRRGAGRQPAERPSSSTRTSRSRMPSIGRPRTPRSSWPAASTPSSSPSPPTVSRSSVRTPSSSHRPLPTPTSAAASPDRSSEGGPPTEAGICVIGTRRDVPPVRGRARQGRRASGAPSVRSA